MATIRTPHKFSTPKSTAIQVAKVVTLSDTQDLQLPAHLDGNNTVIAASTVTKACTSLLLGTGGTLVLTLAGMPDGTTVSMVLAAGWHPLHVKRVWSTGSTALTDVVACWSN